MERIKLLGLTLGKTPPSENVVIKDLNLKSGKKFMMLGEFSELFSDLMSASTRGWSVSEA